MRYNLFIGRYQSPHKGHMHIFDRYLNKNKPVLIAIRDIAPDEVNPLSASDVKQLWEEVYRNNSLVKVIVIPDIESVNYGRGVGYSVEEILVDENIASISATEIREGIRTGSTYWKEFVDASIHGMLEEKIKLAFSSVS